MLNSTEDMTRMYRYYSYLENVIPSYIPAKPLGTCGRYLRRTSLHVQHTYVCIHNTDKIHSYNNDEAQEVAIEL